MKLPLRVYRISNDLAHGSSSEISPRRILARLFVSDAQKLILVSPTLGEDSLLKAALSSGRAVVIPNGVDVADARLRSDDPDFIPPWRLEGDRVVLAAGRMVNQKNFERLVEAASLANEKHPLRLVIIGKGTASARDELFRKANTCGLGERLELPGVIQNPFAAMKHATLVVLPSLWEGSPNVLLEAMAVGTPVVASRTAGNAADILSESQYGLLVDPMNVETIAEAILNQLDPASRVLPGKRVEQYDRNVSLETYRESFMSLLGGPI
jgi:glycosyltransferase involved in cell wall biosynthesis